LVVDRIEILPGEARGRCKVTIVGALPQILAFAQKTTAALTGGGGTSLMVAGARNSHTHRLPPFIVTIPSK
jgi:hypothetical protein